MLRCSRRRRAIRPEAPDTVLDVAAQAAAKRRRPSSGSGKSCWSVALAESLDRASLAAARKVFVDGFLAHPRCVGCARAGVSLDELYDRARRRLAATARRARFIWNRRSSKSWTEADGVAGLRLADGSEREFDFVIVAVPWQRDWQALAASAAGGRRSERRVSPHRQCPDQQRASVVRSATDRLAACGLCRAPVAVDFCPQTAQPAIEASTIIRLSSAPRTIWLAASGSRSSMKCWAIWRPSSRRREQRNCSAGN